VNQWSSVLQRVVLIVILLGTGCSVFCGESRLPEPVQTDPDDDDSNVNTGTPNDDETKPKPKPETTTDPKPGESVVAPRPATFTDYLQTSSLFSTPFRPAFQVVENKTSAVANALVRDSANESVFLQGGGPQQAATDSTPLAGDVPFLHSGPFAFRASMSLDNYLSDNFFGAPGHARTSWLRNYTPGIKINYTPNEQTNVSAFYNATLHDFSSSVERDYYDETGGVSINIKHFGIEGLSFGISDLYTQIGNTIVNPLASTFDTNNLEFKTGSRYAMNSLPVTFKYSTGNLNLEAAYAYDIVDYFGTNNKELDAQQHTGRFGGSYDISPGHCTVFGETSFQYTRYPSSGRKDFDFLNMYVGIRGKFDHLTYQVKLGGSAYDALGPGTITGRPLLSMEARYEYSPHFDVTAIGTRSLETGVMTEGSKVDSYGGSVNIRPMLRGTLTLSHVWQDTFRLTGSDQQIETSALSYRHKILGWLEPRLGMKYSLSSSAGSNYETTWTGSSGIGFKLQSRGRADVDYYHEDLFGVIHRQTTDRWTTGYSYKFNRAGVATFGYDHALRRSSDLHRHIQINELRFGINLNW